MRLLEPPGPFVFAIDQPPHGMRWIVAPSDLPQCVARTRKRRRCQNTIMETFAGPRLHLDRTLVWTRAGVLELHPLSGETEALRLWLEQHCSVHDSLETVDECAVEWRPYVPERDDLYFVRPIPDLPSWPEPTQDWTEVPQWLGELWEIARGQRSRGLPAGASYAPGRGWTA